MEVCVDSVRSATAAERGGATRIELCAGLSEGGTTASLGLLRIVKAVTTLPVFALIRPRAGDFLYDPEELEVMREDIQLCKENGADGIVFGALTSSGSIDTEVCKEFIGIFQINRHLMSPILPAFDMCRDPHASLEVLISLGFERVLTSGQESSALEGLPLIRELIQIANNRITVMPGGAINARNLDRILTGSGAKEFHCSARSIQDSLMVHKNSRVTMGAQLAAPEFSLKFANEELIRTLKDIQAAV
ncbi:copper homeostasis protein cutC homolog isoform X1 [Acanthaster planci]|uniref:Copper homeostasis protein cutC homolog n=1 Tax=Acanthaster planci TaxID=133434 RepID=A0A8B7XLR1_ACAPL|nr:copper homeostasis protein cutC homolog isoform X1 [Acanthaster planci]